MSASVLRGRVLGAIAAGAAIACRPVEAAPDTGSSATATATVTASAPAMVSASATATVTASATATATVTASAATTCPYGKREEYCLDAFTGPPKQVQMKPSFDANGCVSQTEVRDLCNGVQDVLSGPTVKAKKCCFTVCRGQPAPCGRVLVDDRGRERQAVIVPNWDWSGTIESTLTEEARAAWLADALLEHASVAAFARFSLELLAIGAPPSFVADAHRAALDEIEHARLCFALGSSPGEVKGPSALSLDGIVPRARLDEIAAATAEECCAGETFAALVAARALEGTTHPAARDALARIAEDEARHAELGWRFVAWAAARGGDDVRRAVAAGFARGIDRVRRAEGTVFEDPETARASGRIDSSDIPDVATDAIAVITSGISSLWRARDTV